MQTHLQAIKDFATPKKLKELLAVLGELNYYWRFIPHAVHIAPPLHRLCRKNAPFVWYSECNVAF